MNRYWLARPIYKALPAIYILIGFGAARFLPDNLAALLGGVIMTLAGLIVYDMRVGNK